MMFGSLRKAMAWSGRAGRLAMSTHRRPGTAGGPAITAAEGADPLKRAAPKFVAAAAAVGALIFTAAAEVTAVAADSPVPDANMLRRLRRENTDRSITSKNWHYYEGSAAMVNFVLITGNSNPSLCNQIARYARRV